MKPYYDHNGITIYNGDCLELMKDIPDGSIDAIICDPPYGTTACKWDSIIPFAPMWEQLHRVVKPNGAIALFGSEPFSSALRMSNIENYKYDWVWKKSRKTGFQMVKYRPMKDYECVSVFYRKQPTYKNTEIIKLEKPISSYRKNGKGGSLLHPVNAPDGRMQEFTNYNKMVLEFSNEHNVGNFHPTQKPVALMEYLIRTYTNEGETVLDFAMGSGTTLMAAKALGRKAIGIEISEKYCETAVGRLAQEDLCEY